jgi:hypothetical protein
MGKDGQHNLGWQFNQDSEAKGAHRDMLPLRQKPKSCRGVPLASADRAVGFHRHWGLAIFLSAKGA